MTQQKGLTTKEANRLLVKHGENTIQSGKKIRPLRIFAAQFKDLLTLILLGSTILSVLMGEIVEAATIIIIVFLNAVMGFFQEFRTEKSLEKLSQMASPTATVLRDGKISTIPTQYLVPGDYIFLKAGDRIPADCRLIEHNALHCDEAILTGESLPVEKTAWSSGSPLSPQSTVYMGASVTSGNGKAVVIATGLNTEMGKIAGMLDAIEPEQTPLQKSLDQMGKYIAIGCLLICAVVSLTGILRGEPVFDMIITGISLSVAAIPEGLAAIVTIALALSVNRMVKQNAVIRKLHAVETLGCANVICSDKTGTLTENKMTVQAIATADYVFQVTGSGMETGEFLLDGKKVTPSACHPLSMALDVAVVCNNAVLNRERGKKKNDGEEFDVYGEPTEAALIIMGAKGGRFREGSGYRVIKEIPFDSTRKMMSVVVQTSSGEYYMFTKGGSDVILNRCTLCAGQNGIAPLSSALRASLEQRNSAMAGKALRVLGLCYRKLSSPNDLLENNMVFAALAGMQDPPRKEAYEAVLRCRRASIKPVMITGDSRLTACAIAKDLKIFTKGDQVLTGKEIDTMSDQEFEAALPHVTVFARVSPAHKLKIVKALKKQGNIVAMTGDGVNDAPAIKEANIGVSMGVNGTDVTKEASSVILMDDNFATLVSAVEEGRVIYRNIRKFIRYLLSCNIGEVVTMFLAMLMGMPVPLLPIHILLINLVTDGLPAISLGLDPPDKNVMSKPPRRAQESIFSGGLLTTIVFRGFLIGLTTLAVFSAFLHRFGSLELARTGALVALISTQLIHVFECKSEEKSIFEINPFNNMKLIFAALLSTAVMILTVFHPTANLIFKTVPLTWPQLALIGSYLVVAPLLWAFLMHCKFSSHREESLQPAKAAANRQPQSVGRHSRCMKP